MNLNKVVLETDEIGISIQRIFGSGSWYLQVLKGPTIHVESQEFGTYREAVDYAFEKYGLIED